jgi:hypothetical protein
MSNHVVKKKKSFIRKNPFKTLFGIVSKEKQQEIVINTPVGMLRAVESFDPYNPGIALEFISGSIVYQCALLEATDNERMHLLVWGNENNEDYSHKFTFITQK